MSRGPVVLAAGGTGGHLFPAVALSHELIARGRRVALVTDRRGARFELDGVECYQVPSGRSGPGIGAKLRAAWGLGRGVVAAHRLLGRLKPGAVVGFGGYPSLPTLLAATQRRVPTVIHEQNAVIGRANRALAGRVDGIATSFDRVAGIAPRHGAWVVETGNPVRPAILGARDAGYRPPDAAGPIRLLVLGGSLGARILSVIVPAALLLLPAELRGRLMVAQQARTEDRASVEAAYADAGIAADIKSFFDDVPERLAAAHLLICRAGGSTTAELTIAGRPAILVPYAAAIADEQTANARALVERGAAWMVPEASFTPPALAELVAGLLTAPDRLDRAAAQARALGRPAAASALAELVELVERQTAGPA